MNQHSKSEVRSGPQLRDKVRSLVREELLQAAEAVFSEEGLQTARVESIAARAGVSVGTVYNYFADRQALVDAVMHAHREELVRRLQALEVQTEGRPFRERLEASVATVLEHFQTERPYFILMLQAENAPLLQKALINAHDPCNGPFGSIHQHFEKLAAVGVAEGVLRSTEDAGTLGKFLFGVMKGIGLSGVSDPTLPDVRQRKASVIRFFLHGAGPAQDTLT